jgi:oligosaccharide reducing-end xylanase
MKRIAGLCIILVIGAAAYAKTVNISGTVKDGKGAAIAGATVTLFSDTTLKNTTNANGEFTIVSTAINRGQAYEIATQITQSIGIKGNQLRFSIATPASNGVVSIFSSTGKRNVEIPLGKMEAGVHKHALPDLTPGFYVMHITIDQSATTWKMVKTGNEITVSDNVSEATSGLQVSRVAATASVDTLIAKKAGYMTVKKAITSYTQTGIAIVTDTISVNNDNLFASVLGKTEEETTAKLDSGFKQLFHGDQSNQAIYFEGGSGAYIKDINNGDVRSEGQSYGMMICVMMNKEAEFKKIWAWTKQVMGFPNFNWKATTGGQANGGGSAPDGEEYIATALIFAGKHFNNATYTSEGKSVCGATKQFFSQNVVQFVSGAGYTDPSYILPAFYEVWAAVDNANSSYWKTAASTGRNVFHQACNSTTMLGPYKANYSGSPLSGDDGIYRDDSWRIVANIMMDWRFFHVDQWQKTTFAPKHAAFMKTKMTGPRYPEKMQLNGTIITDWPDPCKGVIAPLSMLGFAIPAADAEIFVKALWDMAIPTGQYRYYDGLLYMLSLLHASGRFQLYY